MRLPVTARIALLATVLALVSGLVVVGTVRRAARVDALEELRRDVTEQSDALRTVWRTGGLAALRQAVAETADGEDSAVLAAVLDRRGRPEPGSGPVRLAVRLATTRFAVAVVGSDPRWNSAEAGYALVPLGRHWLLTGRTLDREEASQRALGRALLAATLLSLVLGVAGGLAVARYVARRLGAIADVAEAAGRGDLSRRVGRPAGRGDVFDRLSGRVDAMLERLESLVAELRLVSDSLAHDLRSPLARLRTKAEVAATSDDPVAREAALGGLVAETDAVMRMLAAATEIARAESLGREGFVGIPLAELLATLADLYQPVMDEEGVTLVTAFDRGLPDVAVHRDLLAQAVANLLDNALRHAGGGREVTLRLSCRAAEAMIAVEDRGPGIAAADRARARSRFGRLDVARSRPGAGLGLALVDAVARVHGGRLELGDNAPGLVARLILPLC